MTDHRLTEDDMRRLLTTVAEERAFRHPDRSELRAAVLEEFRILRDHPEGQAPVGDAAIVELVETGQSHDADRPLGNQRRLAQWPLAIAAALLVVVLSGVWAQQRAAEQQVETSSAEATPLNVPADTEPLPIDAGRYSLTSIGGGIQLTLPSDTQVADAGDDSVEFRPLDNQWGSSIVIMNADGSLEDLIASYQDEGLVTTIRSVAAVGDTLVTEFEVRPTEAARTATCRQDESCLAIGSSQVDHDGVNLMRQIDGPDGRSVWTLYRSDTVYSPYVRETNSILETIEFLTGS